MTDRELLDLAAKAAGLKFAVNGDALPGYVADSSGDWRYGWVYWNPLHNSSEALNLAADLGLSLHVHPVRMSASQYHGYDYLGGWMDRSVDSSDDYRRCIVRAAAEIGKAMP